MPRFAVRLLLALVLCLNGFFAPVAVAMHGKAAAAETAAPCHGDDTGAATGEPHDAADPSGCCTPGHCACACVFASSLPIAARDSGLIHRDPAPRLREVAVRTAHERVPLRPPIH